MRPHLRVAFILVHLAAITIASLPSPLGVTRRSNWELPQVTAELRAWSQRLSTLGIEVEPEQLRETTFAAATRWVAVHVALRAPFVPYYECCGTAQAWRLFGAPDPFPSRLWIDLRIDGEWVPVYHEHSDEHAWMRSALASSRGRALAHIYADARRHGDLERLARWLADEAAHDFPRATEIRLRYLRAPLPGPEALCQQEPPPLRPSAEIVRAIER